MEEAEKIYERMVVQRLFSLKVASLFESGELYGTGHLSLGQEASSVGLIEGLEDGDWIVPTHRCHGFTLSRGASPFSLFSELLGSRHGLSKGIGGSMHMVDREHWNLGSSAIVGSGVSLAGGLAFALKRENRKSIAVAILGDGATSRGSVHEMMNLSSVFSLPLLFYIENNHYGMSARSDRMLSCRELYKRGEAYSIKGERVDGNDVIAVSEAVARARRVILEESRPYIIEADTYRQCGHSKSDRLVYRSREEEEEWRAHDPIKLFSSYLINNRLSSSASLAAIARRAAESVESEYGRAYALKDEALTKDELLSYVSAPGLALSLPANRLISTHRGSYREAIREALFEILSSDRRASLIGEDIGIYGGCFGVTGELYKSFPEQIFETPVSEEAFSGMAVGASMLGEHPIVEIMYGDFATLSSDQIINHASKSYFMSGGVFSCPVVFRLPSGGGTGHGAQHSSSPETMFLNTPGLKIVAPSDPLTAKATLKSAVLDNNPVLFIESKALYSAEGEIGDEGYFLELGRGRSYGSGPALVISYSRAMALCREELRESEATFLDLVTIKPLDGELIRALSERHDRILIVEDTPLYGSVGEEVLRFIPNRGRKRIVFLSALSSPVPCSRELEEMVIITKEKIRSAYEKLSQY